MLNLPPPARWCCTRTSSRRWCPAGWARASSGATAPHHPERVQAWSSAVQAARQLADEFEAWPARPDPAQVQPL
ncbi:hypothetical protein H0I39_18845 [Ottowia beijingensis]|uniref:Uncharacterized protein n=1 Tax=Ottowia beijingensis TaxID=1207057 RepID=A0A853IZA7_9BURK|nr:hypothetical protein [Ottowia beijingensis]